jgi:arylsulfatase A
MPNELIGRRQFLAGAAGSALAGGLARSAQSKPPNVIMIYCDDLGYGDLGCTGSKIPTPNIDRMAGEGVQFTQFYSGNPLCSPSRAALLTGRYPVRTGVPRVLFPKDTTGLAESEVTIAQALTPCGYATMCIGKWHLGRPLKYLPTSRGFDEYYGIPYSNDMDPRPLMHNTEVIEEPAKLDTLTPRYTEQTLRFIERSRSAPFFLYLAHTYPHIPLGASDRFRGKSPLGLYGDVVEELDWSTGEIFRALRQHGLDNDTLVMFASDNGPWYQGSPGGFRGRKGMTLEGGQRVPLLARFPGRIPAGKKCAGLASVMDILPTVTKLAAAPAPGNPLDGVDIWPLLTGQKAELDREVLLYFDDIHLQCARWKQWKLHVARYNTAAFTPAPPGGRINLPLPSPELYDLANDPDESYELADRHPDVVAEMQAHIARLMPGFPEEIRRDHEETKAKKVRPTPAGAYPALRRS